MVGVVLVLIALFIAGPIALFIAGAIYSAVIGWFLSEDTNHDAATS